MKYPTVPYDAPLTDERVAILRRMTPEQRLMEAERLYWEARRAEALQVQAEHAGWSEKEIQAEVSRRFLAEAMKEG